jgi:hypothetical protein
MDRYYAWEITHGLTDIDLCMISGFHHKLNGIYALLGFYAAYSGITTLRCTKTQNSADLKY